MQPHITIAAILAAVASATLAGRCLAQHVGDINPATAPASPESWKIRTNLWGAGNTPIADVSVVTGLFGDSGFPQFTANPGFDALPGTFVPGTRVGFHAPDGLKAWSGSQLAPVTDQRLEVSFLTLSTIIGPAPDAGFDLAVQSNGGWHRHFSFEITTEAGGVPQPGVYVLPMRLYSTDPTVIESNTFWIVFDFLAGPDNVNAAVEWIEANLALPACDEDLDFDGSVGASDLASLLGAWGSAPENGFADLDGDGAIGPGDLAILLGSWGSCG